MKSQPPILLEKANSGKTNEVSYPFNSPSSFDEQPDGEGRCKRCNIPDYLFGGLCTNCKVEKTFADLKDLIKLLESCATFRFEGRQKVIIDLEYLHEWLREKGFPHTPFTSTAKGDGHR
jgi:hypothetical protein